MAYFGMGTCLLATVYIKAAMPSLLLENASCLAVSLTIGSIPKEGKLPKLQQKPLDSVNGASVHSKHLCMYSNSGKYLKKKQT